MALMVAKVTIKLSPTGGKSITEPCIDTNNEHVSLYGDIKSFGACYILQHIIVILIAVLC